MELHKVGFEQAKTLYESGWHNKLTCTQIVEFQLFVLELCVPQEIFKRCLQNKLMRAIDDAGFGTNYDGLVAEYLNGQPFPTKDQILSMIPQELRV